MPQTHLNVQTSVNRSEKLPMRDSKSSCVDASTVGRRTAPAHVQGAQGALPSRSLRPNELSINKTGEHLFCQHERLGRINDRARGAERQRRPGLRRPRLAPFP